MSNLAFSAVVVAAFAFHILALLLTLARRRATPLLVANSGFSAIILGWLLSAGAGFSQPTPDGQLIGLTLFELLAFGLAVGGLRGVGSARKLSIAVLIIHLLACSGASIFALTFRMTRMI